MPRAGPAQQQHFGAVISDQPPSKKDEDASKELEKCLRVMGLYEDEEGYRRRKVGGCTERASVRWMLPCGTAMPDCASERGVSPDDLCVKCMRVVWFYKI